MSFYSPDRRTALLFTGTGAHGAYHAGVLRAIREAGVKIDLYAGHGIGAGAAMLAAIDGGAGLWEAGRTWQSPGAARLYGWHRPLTIAAGLAVVLIAALLVPVGAVAFAAAGLASGFLLDLAGTGLGAPVVAASAAWLRAIFAEPYLPTVVPRLAAFSAVALAAVIALAALTDRRFPRTAAGGSWWRVLGAPLDARAAREVFVAAIWDLIRGADPADRPSRSAVSRRYAEVLAESLGQPGFGELLIAVSDLDARLDVAAAFLREPFRQRFFAARPPGERQAEVVDLGEAGGETAIDLLAAAVTPPVGCAPQAVTYPASGFWRGETHRCCDRPGLVTRLLEEADAAGAAQVVVVTAVAPAASPHRLRRPRLDLRGRLGEFHAAAEAAALRDAVAAARARFDLVAVISPSYNPLGPFDVAGRADEASDRRHELAELVALGYDDARRLFIDPVVGGAGADGLADQESVSSAFASANGSADPRAGGRTPART
jgi:hypothetical protein